MTNVGYATLSVIPSTKGFQGALARQTNPAMIAAGKDGGSRFGDSAGRTAGQRFSSAFRTAAKVGIVGTLVGIGGALKLGADAIGEAREAQKATRLTAAAIKSTGGAAKVTRRDVLRLSTNLSKMAGINNELVQGAANVILTFKDIRNEAGKGNKIFNEATRASLNLSVGLGRDLKSSAIQVGKALNDPVAGLTALSRAGVQFTDQQKTQIKTLIESGDKLGAQKIILRELNDEFGGAAKSQASSSDRLKVAWDNVKESLGKGLLPVVQDFSRFLLRKGIPAAQDFSDWFIKDGIPAIGRFIDKAKPVAEKWLPKIGDGFKTAGGYAKTAAGFAGDMISAFDSMPGWVKKVLVLGTAGGLTAKKLGLTKAIGGTLFSKGSTPVNPLYVLDVSKGVGEGGLGAKSGVVAALAKGGLLAAFGIEALIAAKIDKKNFRDGVVGSQGGHGTPFGGPASNVETINLAIPPGIGASKEYKRRWHELNGELDKTHTKFVITKRDVEEFGGALRERIPRTIPFDMPGIRGTHQDALKLLAALLEIRSLHMDTRLDRAGGSGPAGSGINPNLDPQPHGGKRGGTSGRSLVVNQTFNVNTTKDALLAAQHHDRQISAGGFG